MPYMLRYDIPPAEEEQDWRPYTAQDSDHTPPQIVYLTMSNRDPQRHYRWRGAGNVVLACVAIAMFLPFVFSPDTAMYAVRTVVVPVVLLPVRTITTSVPIKATGVKTYPAIQAQGMLTLTNGGSLAQYIQAGFLLTSSSGVEVSTDYGVTVPAGNGESYGTAAVTAHAVIAGSAGNIAAYSIDRTYGTDIFVKNGGAFSGGQDAYSVRYVIAQDREEALTLAKAQIEAKQPLVMLLKPCTETEKISKGAAVATLICQPVTYHAPAGVQVISVHVKGMSVTLSYRVRINGYV